MDHLSIRQWRVQASESARRTINPIRSIVDNMKIEPHPHKKLISLSIGDPTIFGNLETCPKIIDSLVEKTRSFKYNGYPPAIGYPQARQAIASRYSQEEAPLTLDDVIITSGCSGALELAISVLADPGKNILIPKPGFSLYQVVADARGVICHDYLLLPDRGWEIDLDHLESLIDENTAAIVVNNPSNPCGSVYSEKHLNDILRVAETYCIPIIADEIYDEMIFEGYEFHPMASLTRTVPILTCGGIAKDYMVPGWRLGWILVHDRQGIFEKEIRKGLVNLSQIILGANSLIQSILPDIFSEVPKSFTHDTNQVLKTNAELCYERLSQIPGLHPIMPSGAMYMMIGLDLFKFKDIKDDLDFTQCLVREESVFCLPGKCFKSPGFIRIVFCAPKEILLEACNRIEFFCQRHAE